MTNVNAANIFVDLISDLHTTVGVAHGNVKFNVDQFRRDDGYPYWTVTLRVFSEAGFVVFHSQCNIHIEDIVGHTHDRERDEFVDVDHEQELLEGGMEIAAHEIVRKQAASELISGVKKEEDNG